MVLVCSSEALLNPRVFPEAGEGRDDLRREGLVRGEGGREAQDDPGMVLEQSNTSTSLHHVHMNIHETHAVEISCNQDALGTEKCSY